MTGTMLFGAFLAALLYVLIPGPAFLALLGIGAGQGRKAGALFMGGHLAGDLLWSALALVAIVGAKTIGTTVFDILGLLCGFYLAWIGWTAPGGGTTTPGHGAYSPFMTSLNRRAYLTECEREFNKRTGTLRQHHALLTDVERA